MHGQAAEDILFKSGLGKNYFYHPENFPMKMKLGHENKFKPPQTIN
jgi:hypothetical protein